MVAEFGGALHDDGTLDPRGFLACNHSVFLFVPWHLLTGIRNPSLRNRERELGRLRPELEDLSRHFPLGFLAGLFNSTPWQRLMTGRETSSISGRAQPDNYADQPVPIPDSVTAEAVGTAAHAAGQEGRVLGRLLAAGWHRRAAGWRAPALLPPGTATAPLAVARARWGLAIMRPTVRCAALRRDRMTLLAGSRIVARFGGGNSGNRRRFHASRSQAAGTIDTGGGGERRAIGPLAAGPGRSGRERFACGRK